MPSRVSKQKLSETPLSVSDLFLDACKELDIEMVRACLILGVDINSTDQDGHFGLYHIVNSRKLLCDWSRFDQYKKLFNMFVEHPDLNIDQVNRDGILKRVANDGKKVRKLCNLPGIDVNAGNPIADALGCGSYASVEYLLQQTGLNLDVKLLGGRSVGHCAVECRWSSSLKCVELLSKDPRVNWNVRNDSGETPIMVALRNKETEMVKILLKTPGVSLADVTKSKEGEDLLKEVLQEAEEQRRNLTGTVPECPVKRPAIDVSY